MMTKYKLSPKEGADKESRREKLRELMSELKVKDISAHVQKIYGPKISVAQGNKLRR